MNHRPRPGRPGSHAKGSSPARAQWFISGEHLLFTGMREIVVDSHKGKLTLSYNRTLLSLVSPTPGIVWVGLSRPDQPDSAIIPILCHMIYERKGEGHSSAGSSEITPSEQILPGHTEQPIYHRSQETHRMRKRTGFSKVN